MAEIEYTLNRRQFLRASVVTFLGATALLTTTCEQAPTVSYQAPAKGPDISPQLTDNLMINGQGQFDNYFGHNLTTSGLTVENSQESDWSTINQRVAIIIGQGADNPAYFDQFDEFVRKGGSALLIQPANPDFLAAAGLGPVFSRQPAGNLLSKNEKWRYLSDASYHNGVAEDVQVLATLENGAPGITVRKKGAGSIGVLAWDAPKGFALALQGDPTISESLNPGLGFRTSDRLTRLGPDGENWVNSKSDIPFLDRQLDTASNILQQSNLKPMVRVDEFANGEDTVLIMTSDSHNDRIELIEAYLKRVRRIGAKATIFNGTHQDFSWLRLLHELKNPPVNPSREWFQQWIVQNGDEFGIHPYYQEHEAPYGAVSPEDVRRSLVKSINEFQDLGYTISPALRPHAMATTVGWGGDARVAGQLGFDLNSINYDWGALFKDNPLNHLVRGTLRPREAVSEDGELSGVIQTTATLVDEHLIRLKPNVPISEEIKKAIAYLPLDQAKVVVTRILESCQNRQIGPVEGAIHSDFMEQDDGVPQDFLEYICSEAQRLGIRGISAGIYSRFYRAKQNFIQGPTVWDGKTLRVEVNSTAPASENIGLLIQPEFIGREIDAVLVNGQREETFIQKRYGRNHLRVSFGPGHYDVAVVYK